MDWFKNEPQFPWAVDRAHAAFLFGLVLAAKPEHVLELGVGTGYTGQVILAGLSYNGIGKLTCVDNWFDTDGIEPACAQRLRDLGAEIIVSGEKEYMLAAPDQSYDLLVSDADHYQSHKLLMHHLRVVRSGGHLLFHDTNNRDFLGLCGIPEQLTKFPHVHFMKSTRPEERCDRGWFWCIR